MRCVKSRPVATNGGWALTALKRGNAQADLSVGAALVCQEGRGKMATFYHVGASGLVPGTVLQPGNWGKTTRQFGPAGRALTNFGDANILMWELALETARLLSAPSSPSRLDCVFTCETLADATAFRDRFRKGSGVYEVRCDDNTPTYLGNFEAITYSNSTAPFVDHKSSLAISYWRDQPKGIKEILVGGPVTVVGQVA
jgi:hypothetical protein